MASSQSLGFTRMNIPYLLGTMFTADRDRAKPLGDLVQRAMQGEAVNSAAESFRPA